MTPAQQLAAVEPADLEAEVEEQAAEFEREPTQPPAGPPALRPTVYDPEAQGRVDALAYARKKLLLTELQRVVKRAQRDALYDLELLDGAQIPVGPLDSLKNPRVVENAIAEATGEFPPFYGAQKFRPIANALLAIAELEDTGVTPESVTRGWLADYLSGGRS